MDGDERRSQAAGQPPQRGGCRGGNASDAHRRRIRVPQVGTDVPHSDGLPPEHRHRRPGPEAGLSRRQGLCLRCVQLSRFVGADAGGVRGRRQPRGTRPHRRHQRRADDARRDAARDGRALAAGRRTDAARHLHDPDERGAVRGRHPAPRMPQVPGRQPDARPPDGPRDRLSRARRRARRRPACPGHPGRPLRPDCPRSSITSTPTTRGRSVPRTWRDARG